jgi:hypothetical protein
MRDKGCRFRDRGQREAADPVFFFFFFFCTEYTSM